MKLGLSILSAGTAAIAGDFRDITRTFAALIRSQLITCLSSDALTRGLCGTVWAGCKTLNNQLLMWRRGWDSNPRYACAYSGFRDRHVQPLRHLSGCAHLTSAEDQLSGSMALSEPI